MQRPTLPALAILFAAVPLLAQLPATYVPFGSGCPGTGTGLGGGYAAPAAYANTFMPSNNVMGFCCGPMRYQQVFLASELPTAFTMAGLGLRWDNQNQQQVPGALVDLEIHVGYTTKTPTTLSTTFASNFDLGAPVTVLPRRNVTFPDIPGAATDPTQWQVKIGWPTTFAWDPANGNLLVEILQRGSSSGPAFSYIFDCGWSSSTARLWGAATATTGSTDGFAYGYVMKFFEMTHTAVPVLSVGDLPAFGNNMPVRVAQATPSTIALLLTGLSNTWWNGNTLPLSLASRGAPGCSILAAGDSVTVVGVNASGNGSFILDIPVNFALLGLPFWQQYLVYDPTANGLGFVVSNGGAGVIGN